MVAVRLPENIENRLNRLAQQTGLTKSALVRQAILEHIDDLEDCFLAVARARKNQKTFSLEDILAGMTDDNSHDEADFGRSRGQESL